MKIISTASFLCLTGVNVCKNALFKIELSSKNSQNKVHRFLANGEGIKYVQDLQIGTVKLDFKELLIKKQIDFKELFTDYQLFYTINLLLNKELLPI